MRTFSLCWMLVVFSLTACSVVASASLLKMFPLERVLVLTPVTTEVGKGQLWICNDPDCPEGCNSKDPYWGNGLILEESRKLEKTNANCYFLGGN
jgi:hypothetical protein